MKKILLILLMILPIVAISQNTNIIKYEDKKVIFEDTVQANNFIGGEDFCKFHRINTFNTTTTNWDTIKLDTLIASESTSNWSFNGDSSGVTTSDTGLYNFEGCIHIKNNGGASVNAKVLFYISSGGDTARCSQLSQTINRDVGEYVTKSFNGSIRVGPTYPVILNLKVGNTDLDLDTDLDSSTDTD